MVKNTATNAGNLRDGQALGQVDPLEEGMATHSSLLAWRILCTEEPGGLQPMGLQSGTRLSTLGFPSQRTGSRFFLRRVCITPPPHLFPTSVPGSWVQTSPFLSYLALPSQALCTCCYPCPDPSCLGTLLLALQFLQVFAQMPPCSFPRLPTPRSVYPFTSSVLYMQAHSFSSLGAESGRNLCFVPCCEPACGFCLHRTVCGWALEPESLDNRGLLWPRTLGDVEAGSRGHLPPGAPYS